MTYITKVCPECGANLKGIDNIKHAISHWGVKPNELHRLENKDARERYEKLIAEKEDGSKGV